MSQAFADALARLPLVAILRGVKPDEAVEILRALIGEGFSLIETPLNSPDPLRSIRAMRDAAPPGVLIGAGTVLRAEDVKAVKEAGGDLIVMPHADVRVIAAAKGLGLVSLPGVATPSEAFAALAVGADGLKAFPAEMITPTVLKAWRAVVPFDVPIFPVGGIAPSSMAAYVAAGASGFGLGSALYRPGDGPDRIASNARAFVAAWRAIQR